MVYIDVLKETIGLSPLTDGQHHQVLFIQSQGIKATGEAGENGKPIMAFDTAEIQKNQYEAQCLAASYSLTSAEGEQWTVADIKQLPNGAAEAIAKEVFRISGGIADAENFRENDGGAEHDTTEFDGVSLN